MADHAHLIVLATVLSLMGSSAQEVARVDDHALDVSAVRGQILRDGLDAYAPSSARVAVEELIGNHLLAKEARSSGLDQDPQVRAEIDRLLIERLLAERVEKAVADYKPDAGEMAAWQQAHPDELHHPAVAKAVLLSLWPVQGQTQVATSRIENIREALASGTNLTQLAQRFSDDPVDRSGRPVDFVQGRVNRRYPEALVSAILSLTNRGDHVGPIVTPRTVYFASLVDRRERQPVSLEQASRIATRSLIDAKRRSLRLALVETLRAKAVVVIHTNQLSRALEKADGRPPRRPMSPP